MIEVIRGNGPPPSLVMELIVLLPPGSACEAARHKAPDMIGYDIAARILLNVSDWAQSTMRAAGQWEKGKAPKFHPEYRPWADAQKRAEKKKAQEEGVDIHKLFGLLSAKAARQMGR